MKQPKHACFEPQGCGATQRSIKQIPSTGAPEPTHAPHCILESNRNTKMCVFLRLRRPRRIPENLSRKKKLVHVSDALDTDLGTRPLFCDVNIPPFNLEHTWYYCATIHFLVRQLCCVRGCSAKSSRNNRKRNNRKDQARLRADHRALHPTSTPLVSGRDSAQPAVFVSPTVLGTELPNQYTGNKRTNIELGELDG